MEDHETAGAPLFSDPAKKETPPTPHPDLNAPQGRAFRKCETRGKKEPASPPGISDTWRARGLVGYESLRRVRRSSSLCANEGGLRAGRFLDAASSLPHCVRVAGAARSALAYMLMCSPKWLSCHL